MTLVQGAVIKTEMDFKIKVEKLEDGGYMASVDWRAADGGQVVAPGGVVYADSGGEAYEILKGRLEDKGHCVEEPGMAIEHQIELYRIKLLQIDNARAILADLRPGIAAALAKYKKGEIIRIIDGKRVKDCKVIEVDYRPEQTPEGEDPVKYRVHPIKTNGQLSVRLKPFILRPYHRIKTP